MSRKRTVKESATTGICNRHAYSVRKFGIKIVFPLYLIICNIFLRFKKRSTVMADAVE
jgi:hypothetical protein